MLKKPDSSLIPSRVFLFQKLFFASSYLPRFWLQFSLKRNHQREIGVAIDNRSFTRLICRKNRRSLAPDEQPTA